MKARVILEGTGGELANELIEIPDDPEAFGAEDVAIQEVLEGLVLSVGDVIRIVEVPS